MTLKVSCHFQANQSLLALLRLRWLSLLSTALLKSYHLSGDQSKPVWKLPHQSSQLSAILAELWYFQELLKLSHLLLSQLLELRLAL